MLTVGKFDAGMKYAAMVVGAAPGPFRMLLA
jgi:hypothetical protein